METCRDYQYLKASHWRNEIFKLLQKRNKEENQTFKDLISTHAVIFDTTEILKSENVQLTLQNEKLRQDNLSLQDACQSGEARPSEKALALEQKLYRLQEELTELHRRKSENAQQLIDLNISVQEKDRILISKEIRLQEAESSLLAMRTERKNLEQTIIEVEAHNQVIKDEHQALQLAFNSLETKYRKAQSENKELIERWLTKKAEDADKMNDENDTQQRMRQAKLQKDLAEAAKEQIKVDSLGLSLKESAICYSACVPRKAKFKFDAHDGEINAVSWGGSGRIVATGGSDRKLKLWEITRSLDVKDHADLRASLTGSNATITSVTFDSQETLVLGASNDFACRVWTVADQRLRHSLTGHSDKVLSAKFLGESSKVVSGSYDRTLKIWDLRSRACIKTIFAGSRCNDLVTSDGAGTNIISGHFDKRIRFWDTRSESSANEILLQGKVTSLHLSLNSYYLLSCVRDDTLKILDLRMNQVTRTLCADGFKVGCDWTRACFSPDSQYITVGSHDGTVFIWNALSGKIEKTLKEHNTSVVDCAWCPDGSSFISVDKNKKAVVWSDY